MDEIVIGEKKYVSSKQAAKATGYAKDYIGQLCREGRVPARLVGRSWYVLESAIHDHRFGEPRNEPIEPVKPASEKETTPLEATWEQPRYEMSKAEMLPSVSILHAEAPSADMSGSESEASQRLQETWQAWFDRFESVAGASKSDVVEEKTEIAPEAEAPADDVSEQKEHEEEQIEEVAVPVRAVYEPEPEQIDNKPSELPIEEKPMNPKNTVSSQGLYKKVFSAFQIAGAVIATVAVVTAALGSGYFDKYILSNRQVSQVAGVILYNK